VRELERIGDQLRRSFDGDAFYGPPLWELVRDITAEKAAARPRAGTHSIWEIVLHVAAWEGAVRSRIEGGSNFPSREIGPRSPTPVKRDGRKPWRRLSLVITAFFKPWRNWQTRLIHLTAKGPNSRSAVAYCCTPYMMVTAAGILPAAPPDAAARAGARNGCRDPASDR
jgi:hypothetical protein